MEMRAKEDIKIGQNITPPLAPLAFSLYNSTLSSHCSSCSRPLSTSTTTTNTFLHHCSLCSSSSTTTSLHFSSGEHHLLSLLNSTPSLFPHSDTSSLRLSLCLLHLLPSPSLSPRLLGLLTNRHKFTDSPKIRASARVIAMARAIRDNAKINIDSDFHLEEAVLCLVITNAVDIDLNGERLGIAVYDTRFSWINHSCSPNSSYRFVPSFEVSEGFDDSSSLRIFASGDGDGDGDAVEKIEARGVGNYGPRLIVRSIKEIRRGEEVTITYTDLLQPTALRQSELFLEYKFFCNCERCSAVPQDYVDRALQETYCVDLHKDFSRILDKNYKEKAVEMLGDMLDSTVAEYMEVGDPVSCCEKVEGLLSEGLSNQHLEQGIDASDVDFRLSPFHYLSLKAYITLISTYKIRALLSGEMHLQDLDMIRISVAYSLLLAGATHHLFLSEPSLINSAVTFWIDAGQSLLSLGRSPSWNSFANREHNLLGAPNINCPWCSLMDKFESCFTSAQSEQEVFDDITRDFRKCTSIFTSKIWGFLIQGCKYFKDVKDPIDYSWIHSMRTSENPQLPNAELNFCHDIEKGNFSKCVSGNEFIDVRTDIIQLGVHCLMYGGYLSSICNDYSCSTRLIRNLIHT